MKVLYIRPYTGEMEMVTAGLPGHEAIAAECVFDVADEVLADVAVLSVFVDYQVTADVLAKLPSLTCIATRSAGFDHIDRSVTAERNITIVRVPHYGARTVAEYAFALMFALSRNVYRSYLDLRSQASDVVLERYEGFDLCGKTLAVVGTGVIGKSVCAIGRGIGMKVLAFDVHPDVEFAKTQGITYGELDTILPQADIVTIHVPSLPATHHLINQERLALMKQGSYLINTARGDIVDTMALVAALKNGHLAGAGLDVLEGEHELRNEVALLSGDEPVDVSLWKTMVADHALIDLPQVVVTPHIAFDTKEAKREITEITLANIVAFAAGTPQNIVSS